MANRERPRRRVFRSKQVFGGWVLEKRIGRGGNGEVWRAHYSIIGVAAIKLLSFENATAFMRFRSEVEALERLRNVRGITPLLDRYIPARFNDDTPWIVMPLAEPIWDHLISKDPIQNVERMLDLAIKIN